MHFDSISDLRRALAGGDVRAGDVVYVAPDVYAALSYPEQTALVEGVRRVRARLVTDLPTVPAIAIARADGVSGPGDETDADAGPSSEPGPDVERW